MNQYFPYEVLPLPYSYTSMMPCCDANTLYYHHDQFYANEVNRLNRLVVQHRLTDWSLVDLITKEINLPTAQANEVKDAAGSVYNHQLYFDGVTDKTVRQPSNRLMEQVVATYGSMQNFVRLLTEAAQSIPGVGWVWLVAEENGALHLATTRDNEVVALNAVQPVFVIDVWEHAYFPVHHLDLPAYIHFWFSTLDWEKADQRYLYAKIRNRFQAPNALIT